jgi:hypothetical protein
MVGEFRNWGVFRVWLYRFYRSKFRFEDRDQSTKDKFAEMQSRHQKALETIDTKDDKQETPFPNSFRVSEADDKVLADTWLSRYVAENRKALARLKEEVTVSVSDQNSILEDMFDQDAEMKHPIAGAE